MFADLDDNGPLRVEVETIGIDRVDAYVDDRPRGSLDVDGSPTTFTITDVTHADHVRVDGFQAGSLVASRSVVVDGTAPGGVASGGIALAGAAAGDAAASGTRPTVLYVHGAGNKPKQEDLKRAWDSDLFHRDMGTQTAMVHYADILHHPPRAIGADGCGPDDAVSALLAGAAEVLLGGGMIDEVPGQLTDDADVADFAKTPAGEVFAARLGASIAEHAAASDQLQDPLTGVFPLPPFLRELLLRELLRRLVPDAEAYFFDQRKRAQMQDRLRAAITGVQGPVIVVSHSLGTVIAYDVLREPALANCEVTLLVTLGSPLGYAEIQDQVRKPLQVPAPVGRWTNVADRLDPVALDTGLNNDFHGRLALVDLTVDNVSPNSHAACGYLRTATVRNAVNAALPVPAR